MMDDTQVQPPTGPPPLPPRAERRAWVTIVGVIGIAVAFFGVMAPVGAWAVSAIQELAAGLDPSGDGQLDPVGQVQVDHAPTLMALGFVGVPLAILLAVASIALLRRRPWARRAFLVWACLSIPFVVTSAFFNAQMNLEMADAMVRTIEQDVQQDHGPPMPEGFSGLMGVFSRGAMLAGVVFQLVWGLALPVFSLVWFNRKTVVTQVATWGGGAGGSAVG